MLVPLQTQNHFGNHVALDLVGATEDRDLAQVEVVRGQRRRVVVAVHGVVGPAVQVGRVESQARGGGGVGVQPAGLPGELAAPPLLARGPGGGGREEGWKGGGVGAADSSCNWLISWEICVPPIFRSEASGPILLLAPSATRPSAVISSAMSSISTSATRAANCGSCSSGLPLTRALAARRLSTFSSRLELPIAAMPVRSWPSRYLA